LNLNNQEFGKAGIRHVAPDASSGVARKARDDGPKFDGNPGGGKLRTQDSGLNKESSEVM